MNIQLIPISDIRLDGGTQGRCYLNEPTIEEYKELLENNIILPDLIVFFDDTVYWLVDGFHRIEAYKRTNNSKVSCIVKNGTLRDALIYSASVNAIHGLPRSNEDKRKIVQMLLQDEEWSQWNNSVIAQKAAVSPSFVGKLRKELNFVPASPEINIFVEPNDKKSDQIKKDFSNSDFEVVKNKQPDKKEELYNQPENHSETDKKVYNLNSFIILGNRSIPKTHIPNLSMEELNLYDFNDCKQVLSDLLEIFKSFF